MQERDGLDTFLEEYDEEKVEREIQRLDSLREELSLVRRLKALRSGQPLSPPGRASGALVRAVEAAEEETRQAASNGTARPETRRAAIETVMKSEPRRPWKLKELRDALVERGWLGDDDEDYHRLQVTASRMSQRKQLVRVRPGFYKLPASPQASLDPDDRSEEP